MPTKVQVEKRSTFTGHRDCVYTLEPSAAPHQFFSAAGDGMVVQWDLARPDEGKLVARVPASVYALHYLPAVHQLCIGQNFDGLHVIDLDSQQEIKSVKLTSAAIFDLKSDGKNLFVATGDGVLIVVDGETFAVRKHLKASDKSVRCLAVNRPSGELAVGYSDNHIRVFDLDTFTPRYAFEAHGNSVFTLQYTPDGQYLLSGSRDAHLKIWDVSNHYILAHSVVAHMYAINHICFSPDGKYFLTGSMDKSIKVWDAETTRLLKVIDRARHAGHGTSVNKLLWTDYQDLAVSCSDDRTLSVWQLAFGGEN
jgi:WD40 repeat protein